MFGQKTTFGTPSFGSAPGTGFGAPATQSSGLFGSTPATTSGGLFGGSTAAAPSGGLFGTTNAFGQTTSSLFGTTQSKPLFGASAPAFGAPGTSGTFGFGAQQQTPSAGGMFGQPAQSTAGGLFGSAGAPGSTLFGSAQTPSGTTVKFEPVVGSDTMLRNSIQTNITTKHQCITSMKHYEGKSLEQNTSITHCLREFSATETLCNEHKYYCDVCCSKQEAQKRMRIKKLPLILALHLKRFKYMEQFNRYTKLSYRVLFPLELRLFNTSHDAVNPDRLYELVAVVVHCGSTPNRGHYITVVKYQGCWLLFDDDIVDKVDSINIEDFFGVASDGGLQKNSESGYILFYQARDT